eukprot:scaffold646531_cov20-Prasinocladus_malaysianus.AAC.1
MQNYVPRTVQCYNIVDKTITIMQHEIECLPYNDDAYDRDDECSAMMMGLQLNARTKLRG